MHFNNISTATVFALCAVLSACSTITDYNAQEERMTIAKAQQEIKIGMSSAAVIEALGTPNMVTTDDKRRETWVYDRVSTNIQASSSQNGVWLLLFGGRNNNQKVTSSQRTLTIIVKFDKDSKVRDFTYRTSTF